LAVEALGVQCANREIKRALWLAAAVNAVTGAALKVNHTCVAQEALRRIRLAAAISTTSRSVAALDVGGARGLVCVTLGAAANAVTGEPEAAVDVGVAGIEAVADLGAAVVVADEPWCAVCAYSAESAVGANVFAATVAANFAAATVYVCTAGLIFAVVRNAAEPFAGRSYRAVNVWAAHEQATTDAFAAAVRAQLAALAIRIHAADVDSVADFLAATVQATRARSTVEIPITPRRVDAGRNTATGLVTDFTARAVCDAAARDAVRARRRLWLATACGANVTGGAVGVTRTGRHPQQTLFKFATTVEAVVSSLAWTSLITDEDRVADFFALAAANRAAVRLTGAVRGGLADTSVRAQEHAVTIVTPPSIRALPRITALVPSQFIKAIRRGVNRIGCDQKGHCSDAD
jgi:hypothetical protein